MSGLTWGYPKMDGLEGKIALKWMMTGGTPISNTLRDCTWRWFLGSVDTFSEGITGALGTCCFTGFHRTWAEISRKNDDFWSWNMWIEHDFTGKHGRNGARRAFMTGRRGEWCMIWHILVIMCQNGAFPPSGNLIGKNDNDWPVLGLDKLKICSSVLNWGMCRKMVRYYVKKMFWAKLRAWYVFTKICPNMITRDPNAGKCSIHGASQKVDGLKQQARSKTLEQVPTPAK